MKLAAALAARLAAGRSLRQACPRASHAALPRLGRDPVAVLQASNRGRLPALVPIRYARMAKSPFAFLRGAAALMAQDIGPLPPSGLRVQVCGDCHLSNFGGWASPERTLLFGINDFDETTPGAPEWDLKRLAASFVVAMRQQGLSGDRARDAVRELARTYREQMRAFAGMPAIDVWYHRVELDEVAGLSRTARERRLRADLRKQARRHTSWQMYPELVAGSGGHPVIADHPPLIYHPRGMPAFSRDMKAFITAYRRSLPAERRVLLDRYEPVDVAIKVVGVGSVGTRCAVALLMAGPDDPLLLQIKEARPSVWARWSPGPRHAEEGARVVAGQRMLQPASDIFLGYARASRPAADFYVRQLVDRKVSVPLDGLSGAGFIAYARVCALALAKGHARTGDPAAISGYLGQGGQFDKALATFANRYADQTERDHAKLVAAVRSGRVQAAGEP